MPAVVEETFQSRKKSIKSREREYKISGATDDDEALTELLAYVPTTLGGLLLDTSACSVEEFGRDVFLGTAQYIDPSGDPSRQHAGAFSISFDIGSTTTNLKQSYSTRQKYTASGHTARDFKGAINVDGDGNIGGVDVTTPVLTYTVNATYDAAAITNLFVANLKKIVGRTNNASYRGHEIGELLLTSVTGQPRDANVWDLTFKFGVIENTAIADNFKIDTVGPIQKYGWEHLWAYYEEVTETVSGKTIIRRKATNAYVEQVYKMANYADLGIPGGV
ncbi:MAG TPA: hypothetical protein VF595_01145 [Tepidisphaeraceae bacterium]|jgi:hypothetical protein